MLHPLVYTCIRYYSGLDWMSNYVFPPIDSSQSLAISTLYNSTNPSVDEDKLDKDFHAVCIALFAHRKHKYNSSFLLPSNFFSPVICFIVIHCITEYGGTPNSLDISNIIAPIMYSICAAILQESLLKASSDRVSIFQ